MEDYSSSKSSIVTHILTLKPQNAVLQKLGPDWETHIDAGGEELTRSSRRLEHNAGYVHSLSPLYKWFRDDTKDIKSLHIHLDKERHKNIPRLGNLFSLDGQDIRDNSHNTWEVRCLNVPQGVGNLHPGRVEDLIGMYIHAAKTDTDTIPESKIKIAGTSQIPLEQILFGHISAYIQEPEGRLAGLMALHDSMALHNFTPVAFLNTYETSSLSIIADSLKNKLKNRKDQTDNQWLDVLKAVGDSTVVDKWNEFSSDIKIGLIKLDKSNLIPHSKILDLSFQDRDPSVRLSAVAYCGKDPIAHRDKLIELIHKGDDEVRVRAYLILMKNVKANRKLIIEATTDEDELIRERALEALVDDPNVEHNIYLNALSDSNSYVKAIAITKLSQHPDLYHQQLVRMISEKGSYLGGLAMEGLANDPDKGRRFLEDYILKSNMPNKQIRVLEMLADAHNLRIGFLIKCFFQTNKELREYIWRDWHDLSIHV